MLYSSQIRWRDLNLEAGWIGRPVCRRHEQPAAAAIIDDVALAQFAQQHEGLLAHGGGHAAQATVVQVPEADRSRRCVQSLGCWSSRGGLSGRSGAQALDPDGDR